MSKHDEIHGTKLGVWKSPVGDSLPKVEALSELTRADYRNMYEALVDTQQKLKNALSHVEHQISRFETKSKERL